ncbi:MAG: hypothetical protein CML13_09385 [Puniceicoccaceae bacterium]|nr:hypothetical protein [Puniceicoccaceae bacterium]
MPTDIMTDLRRNFDVMVLGSTRVWACAHQKKLCSIDNQKQIVFALPTRTVEGDWLILQRMHSYLKKDGLVLFPIDLGDPNLRIKGLGYAELNLLHPVTLEARNLNVNERKLGNPVWHYSQYTRVFLYTWVQSYFYKFLPYLSSLRIRKLKARNIDEKIQSSVDFLRLAAGFCQERSIRLMPVFILPDLLCETDRVRLSETISESVQELDYHICANAREAIELAVHAGEA